MCYCFIEINDKYLGAAQNRIFAANLPNMQFENPVSVKWLAEFTGAKLIGNEDQLATGINEIHKVTKGDISFVDFEKYYNTCLNSPATIIIINKSELVLSVVLLLLCYIHILILILLIVVFRCMRTAIVMLCYFVLLSAHRSAR